MPKAKRLVVKRPTFVRRAINFRSLLILVTIVFALLSFFAKQYDYFNFDLTVTLHIQSLNFSWFDNLMKFVSFLGNVSTVTVLVFLLAFFGYLTGNRKAAFMLLISTIGGLAISYIFKTLVARSRPDPTLVNQIGEFIKSDSFPSGHVLGAVSFYGFLLYISYTQLKKNIIKQILISISLLAILLMGISRIYLGAHWFSDVLGAYLLGFIWLTFVVFVYQKLKNKIGIKD